MKSNPIFYDMNVESWGWNRKEGESVFEHYERIMESDYQQTVCDTAVNDMNPVGNIKVHDKIRTESDTFYFSITNGLKSTTHTKNREVLKTPEHTS